MKLVTLGFIEVTNQNQRADHEPNLNFLPRQKNVFLPVSSMSAAPNPTTNNDLDSSHQCLSDAPTGVSDMVIFRATGLLSIGRFLTEVPS